MSCSICLEDFSAGEHRPKSLPCGHSYCLPCLRRLPNKTCPKDRKAFEASIDSLPDNFMLIELCERSATASSSSSPLSSSASPGRSWCRDCEAVASAQCADAHSVCSLRKARADRAGPLLAGLQAGEAALRALRRDLDAAADGLDADLVGCRGRLEGALDALDRTRQQLQAAVEADEAVFQEASEAARLDGGLAGDAALLQLASGEAATELSLSLRCEAGAWTASLRPQGRPAARLLLGQLLLDGELLRREDQQDVAQPDGEEVADAAAPRWKERSNEQALDGKSMAAAMEPGSRVVRGEHWYRAADAAADGVPPGRGTVTAADEARGDNRKTLAVDWDSGGEGSYTMDLVYERHPNFQLKLVPSWPRTVFTRKADPTSTYLNAVKISSSMDSMAKADLLAPGKLSKVRFLELRCDVSPPWAKLVLRAAAPHLQGLCLARPTAEHLRVARDMPLLTVLLLSGADSEAMRLALSAPGLTHLEVHCPFDAPLGAPRPPRQRLSRQLNKWLRLPEADPRLRKWLRLAQQEPRPSWLRLPQPCSLKWLRLGVYPLSAALALVRAHAATLETLELVAASVEPYGCPDLAAELRRCGLQWLRRFVLWRESDDYYCRHSASSCKEQKLQLWNMFTECGLTPAVLCSDCDEKDP